MKPESFIEIYWHLYSCVFKNPQIGLAFWARPFWCSLTTHSHYWDNSKPNSKHVENAQLLLQVVSACDNKSHCINETIQSNSQSEASIFCPWVILLRKEIKMLL